MQTAHTPPASGDSVPPPLFLISVSRAIMYADDPGVAAKLLRDRIETAAGKLSRLYPLIQLARLTSPPRLYTLKADG